uniref:DNA polymerase epsilon subunit 3 n=1 Tax=Cyprinus carpio carpio TaxID=630221 RepID=A0A9J8BF42_CYPCA
MAERPEDLNLPNAVITRIIKEALPDGVNVSKEARKAISQAASIFVLYATSWLVARFVLYEKLYSGNLPKCNLCVDPSANNFAMKAKRKTLNAGDVMSAMEEMEFERFLQPLRQALEAYKKGQKGKKEASEQKRKEKKNITDENDKSRDEEEDEHMDDEQEGENEGEEEDVEN